ncbi:MAG: DNA-processing protein DprA [Acutalibacteraceae bacterium]
MYDDRVYWIWLQYGLGIGSSKVRLVYDYYNSAAELYSQVMGGNVQPVGLSDKDIDNLRSCPISKAKNVFDKTLDLGYDVICICDKAYPKGLRDIDNPPAVLYVWGELPQMDGRLVVSMVGTRTPQKDYYDLAYEMSLGLAQNNTTVISGGALGIDTASHQGALAGNGRTVAVLGCGLNYPYLSVNEKMRQKISQSGAVISEYPLDTPAIGKNFPVRNRIIAALGNAVVVIQGRDGSGTMITAGLALKYNKRLMSVPGNPTEIINSGNNRLIRDGAVPVMSYSDVLGQFFPDREIKKLSADKAEISVQSYVVKEQHKNKAVKKTKNTVKSENPTQENKTEPEVQLQKSDIDRIKQEMLQKYNFEQTTAAVLNCLSDKPTDIDDIVSMADLDIGEVLAAMTELEIYGAAVRERSRLYRLNI